MNKKGMTLIELIAVIAIIAIITIMVAPNIIEMRRETIESTIDNKVTKIKNAAINYAQDNLSSVPDDFTINENLDYSSDECIQEKSFDADKGLAYCEKYCLIVYINTLVEQGYLAGDDKDKTNVLHPLTGTSINYDKVCVRYDTDVVFLDKSDRTDSSKQTRKLVAYILDEDSLYDDIE
jgi:prepilin-type N-terminal cleavage/methylation domain-containing protein